MQELNKDSGVVDTTTNTAKIDVYFQLELSNAVGLEKV